MPRLATGLLDEQHQPDDLDAAAGTAGTAAEESDQYQQQRGEQWPAARVGDCKTGAGAIRDYREQTFGDGAAQVRSEEHTYELQSLMRISYSVFCIKQKISTNNCYYI